jgi:mono/diheme cytochrome c family protein
MTPKSTMRMVPVAAAALLWACRGQTSTEPPIIPFRGMHEMPRYDAQEVSRYFADRRAMRPPVEGTIAREMEIDPQIAEGVNDDGSYVLTIPDAVLERAGPGRLADLVARGRTRYDIYCSPCHAYTGDGNGMVVQRANAIDNPFPAANLHEERIRRMPDGQLFATISNGVRTMPAYRAQIPVQDRWAIVAYVRALQLSQAGVRTAALEPRDEGESEEAIR